MNVLDLFSGIGGFSLGLERAGFETVAFCEIEKYPQQILKRHWPHVPIYDDINDLIWEIEEITKELKSSVLDAEKSCQSHSVCQKEKNTVHGGVEQSQCAEQMPLMQKVENGCAEKETLIGKEESRDNGVQERLKWLHQHIKKHLRS